jgi:RNA polymerase sigma-70 factor (ECF subfamily)
MGDDTKSEGDPVLAASRQEASGAVPGQVEKLFVEHHRRVFQAAYRITGSATDAEDVLQTVFLRLLRREGAGGTGLSGTPGSYLHLAAVNGALDIVRSRTSSRSTPLDEGGMELAEAPRRSPEGRREDGEIREALRVALTRLTPRAAEMFVLRYLEGFTNREIARMLGRPQAVVAVTLHRARRRLQGELRQFAGGRS